MNIGRASLLVGGSTFIRLLGGLLTIKIIAIVIGTEGLGVVGQLMGAISICTLMAAGGIQNGLISRLPPLLHEPASARLLLSTANTIAAVWAGLAAALIFAFSETLSLSLLKTADYAFAFKLFALAQFFLGFAALYTGIINSQSKTALYALSSSIAVVLGLAGLAFSTWRWQLEGAVYGLVWAACCPALVYLARELAVKDRALLHAFRFDRFHGSRLGKYTLMVLVSAVCMPLVQIVLRDSLLQHYDWHAVGVWQASIKISDASLQFYSTLLASYFLPRVATAIVPDKLRELVWGTYKFLLPLIATSAVFIILFSEPIVLLLFSNKFSTVAPMLPWQALGDAFRTVALVLGYVGVSRGNLSLYVAAEVFQAGLMLGLGLLLIPAYGPVGAVYAYAITYAIYLLGALLVYKIYIKNLSK